MFGVSDSFRKIELVQKRIKWKSGGDSMAKVERINRKK